MTRRELVATLAGVLAAHAEDKGVPAEMPADLPVYRPSAPVAAQEDPKKKKKPKGPVLLVRTTDPVGKVYTFYKGALKTNGWSMEQTSGFGPTQIFTASKDNILLHVRVTDTDNGIMISHEIERNRKKKKK